MRTALFLGLGALGAAGPGCLRETAHQCATTDQCGIGGVCEADGHCSFDDPACDSGRRYGDGAGAMSGTCVGGDDPDANIDRIDAAFAFDAPIDATPDLIAHVPFADETLGSVVLVLNGDQVIDTTALEYSGAIQPWLSMIVSEQGNLVALARVDTLTIDLGKTLDVTGALPLIVIARRIDVNGSIDASANAATDGPGAVTAGISLGGDGMSAGNNDDGGGGGAGFGTAGTTGGDADAALGGMLGMAAGDADLTRLVGSSRGGRGAATGCTRAAGGGGGGGIQLYAAEMLTVNGTIDVSAGGGRRNSACASGGGGGGAGGAIYLQSTGTVVLGGNTRLAANGGAGASGGAIGAGADGQDGAPGTNPAQGGGAVAGGGGTGGNGGAGTTAPVAGGDGTSSGGGGGGAVGRIVIHAPAVNQILTAQVSPPFVRKN